MKIFFVQMKTNFNKKVYCQLEDLLMVAKEMYLTIVLLNMDWCRGIPWKKEVDRCIQICVHVHKHLYRTVKSRYLTCCMLISWEKRLFSLASGQFSSTCQSLMYGLKKSSCFRIQNFEHKSNTYI